MSLFFFLMAKFNQNKIKIKFQSSDVCARKKYQSSQISIFKNYNGGNKNIERWVKMISSLCFIYTWLNLPNDDRHLFYMYLPTEDDHHFLRQTKIPEKKYSSIGCLLIYHFHIHY
jgi:hypothetical protein